MRYQKLGVVGYGLQIAVLLFSAAVSFVLFTTTPLFRGIEVTAFVTPVPGLVIALAWFYAGREKKSGLFTATGVVGLALFFAGIGSAIWTSVFGSQSLTSSSSAVPLGFFFLLALTSVIGLLGATNFVLETISFFSAGKIFRERMFRFAGWSRVAAVIAAAAFFIIVVTIGILSAFTSTSGNTSTLISLQISPSPAIQFQNLFGTAIAGVYLILMVPEVFAFLGFRRILSAPDEALAQPAGQSPPVPQTAPPRYCPSCGSPAILGAKFCENCGRQLNP